ncbi:MAG TPA: alcohol dehydrogenase catalytic domain-containing protein [Candidatus Polarisedimenticolia bacterium]|nr:alcohol dehydrogenase catalytic domain-containing protein [Candidatus Polarisedimenticolia bacterium]
MMPTMKAIVLRQFGPPENLVLEEVPAPAAEALRPGEVLVRVEAVGVCYHDLINRQGNLPRTKLPSIPGHEIAGTVFAVGPEVNGFLPGARVATIQRAPCGRCDLCRRDRGSLCKEGVFFGEEIPGGYAQWVVAPVQALAPVPDGLATEEAAICACTLGTALHVARTRGRVQPGEQVLITGASGGVGLHAIQLVRHLGGRPIAVTSSEGKAARLREAGAEEVIVSPDLKFAREVRRKTAGRGADVVLEITGALTFDQSLRSLAAGGRLVVVGNLETRTVDLNPGLVILKELEIIGSFATSTSELREVFDLVRQGTLKPVVSQVLPLEEAASAHRSLQERAVLGRVVLTV